LSGADISIFVGLPKPNIGFCSTVCCCKSMNSKKKHCSKTTTTHIDRDGHDRSEAKQNNEAPYTCYYTKIFDNY